jgi:hypothetical protein
MIDEAFDKKIDAKKNYTTMPPQENCCRYRGSPV